MAEVSLTKQFRGQVRLLTLLVWRVGKTTDIDCGLNAAIELKMISEADAAFVKKCIALSSRLENGEDISGEVTPKIVEEIQKCVIRLNSADPA